MLGFQISKGMIKPDPERMKPLLDLPVPPNTPALKRALGLFSYYSSWVPRFSDQIQPLIGDPKFPLDKAAVDSFASLKQAIADASITCPNEKDVLVLESDASDVALSASLNQGGKPVAFFSRTLQSFEKRHASIEKEACAIIEACRKWKHYLQGRHFILITDQEAVSFMFDTKRHGTIKNNKIMRWRLELSCLDYEIKYRPGKDNVTADCLTRAYCNSAQHSSNALVQLHTDMCHPGVSRFYHHVRSRNLPYSIDEVKEVTAKCRVCSILKPNFFKPVNPPLIKATQPFERLSIDFKGPVPTNTANKYMLTVIDEFSRFPFAFPCKDMVSSTIIARLTELFSVFGTPAYIHSDNGPSLVSNELRDFFLNHGIGYSNSAPYNPQGNGQCERYNGIVWKTAMLALASKSLPVTCWESVLPAALHSIRTLLCTATNQTPHDRLFNYVRRAGTGHTTPPWLQNPGPVLMRRHVRSSKYDPLCDEVELIKANPSYAYVRKQNGNTQTVSLRDLAPLGIGIDVGNDPTHVLPSDTLYAGKQMHLVIPETVSSTGQQPTVSVLDKGTTSESVPQPATTTEGGPRRSTRTLNQTQFYTPADFRK